MNKQSQPSEALAAFKTFKAALLRHIKCEEDLIFPVLARAPGVPASSELPILQEEHQIIVPLLMEVEKHLKDGTDSSASERMLFEKLQEHNAREELKFYGFIDTLLSDHQKEAVSEALKSQRVSGE